MAMVNVNVYQTTVTNRQGESVQVMYRVEMDLAMLDAMAAKAAKNKSGMSRDGTTKVTIINSVK